MSKVIITGGAGSIGTELCWNLVGDGHTLYILDTSEYNLVMLARELGAGHEYLLCDVCDARTLDRLFSRIKPDVVYHAAALKHVPILQYQNNAVRAIHINIIGTRNVLECAVKHDVAECTYISTDKSVRPVSVMGATKHIAEQLVCEYMCKEYRTRFRLVRFGNVVGSNGSVIPKWMNQIATGGPVTLTHKGMYRFMMSLSEAVQLVVSCQTLGCGTYALNMGELKSMHAEAVALIGDRDIEIVETGIRPGEKLVEALWDSDTEYKTDTEVPRVWRITKKNDTPELLDISMLETQIDNDDWEAIIDWVRQRSGYHGNEILSHSL